VSSQNVARRRRRHLLSTGTIKKFLFQSTREESIPLFEIDAMSIAAAERRSWSQDSCRLMYPSRIQVYFASHPLAAGAFASDRRVVKLQQTAFI
jgi:hypothetical protein